MSRLDARELKLGFVLPSIAYGGMESHCVELAREFSRRGAQVAAIIPDAPELDGLGVAFREAAAYVRRLDLDARNGRLAQLRSWLALVRALRLWRPDVIHVHTGGPSGGVSLVAAARLSGAAVVLTEHDTPDDSLSPRQVASRRWMDSWVHALVAVSRRNGDLRRLRLGAPAGRFFSVLNGVPIPEVTTNQRLWNRREIRERQRIASDAVVIGSVVRLVEGKGLHDLVRAFAQVVQGAPRVELLLVGDGPLRGDLMRLSADLGVADRVHFAGYQTEPGQFVDAMDLFVLAVPAGSMSIALLEAMARGVCSVITFPGPEEPVIDEQTGLTALPNDPEDLARVLRRAVFDPHLRARLGEAGAAHVRDNFSVQRVADDLLGVYASAYTRASGGRSYREWAEQRAVDR